MKTLERGLLSGLLAIGLLGACQGTPGICPEPGLDSARRCRRHCCVGTVGGPATPLPCECSVRCLCWKMAGHPPLSEDGLEE